MNEEGDEEKLLKNLYCPLSMLLIHLLLDFLSSNAISNCISARKPTMSQFCRWDLPIMDNQFLCSFQECPILPIRKAFARVICDQSSFVFKTGQIFSLPFENFLHSFSWYSYDPSWYEFLRLQISAHSQRFLFYSKILYQ